MKRWHEIAAVLSCLLVSVVVLQAQEMSPSLPVSAPAATPLRVVAPAAPPAVTSGGGRLPVSPPAEERVFAWDALMKEVRVKPGVERTSLRFSLTNISASDVIIRYVRTSCGCTVAKLPSVPWRVRPKQGGFLDVEVDVRGKIGVLTKTVTVDSSAGYRYLTVRVQVPGRPPVAPATAAVPPRSRNLQVSLKDRQAVLRGDCATCHLAPGQGKSGRELYQTVCGVCHEAEHRASMVPDLHAQAGSLTTEQWRTWISMGKADSVMPAWALTEGGVLTEEQVESLVRYLSGPFRTETEQTKPAVPVRAVR